MGAVVEVSYFNSYKLLSVNGQSGTNAEGLYPGLPWNPIGYPEFPVQARTNSNVSFESVSYTHLTLPTKA